MSRKPVAYVDRLLYKLRKGMGDQAQRNNVRLNL